jgi:Flp pilus assembly protein TadD
MSHPHLLTEAERWHLQRSDGYMDLRMLKHAAMELDRVAEQHRSHPLYQQAKLRLSMEEQNWSQAVHLAQRLTRREPLEPSHWVQLAYATRRLEGIEKALPILRTAHRHFPREPVIPFNLACYECQLGHPEEALRYLKQAEVLSPRCRTMALEDEDLKPLWPRLED